MIAMMPHPPLPRALSFLHSRLASTPPRPAHHHIDLPAAALRANQPAASFRHWPLGAGRCACTSIGAVLVVIEPHQPGHAKFRRPPRRAW